MYSSMKVPEPFSIFDHALGDTGFGPPGPLVVRESPRQAEDWLRSVYVPCTKTVSPIFSSDDLAWTLRITIESPFANRSQLGVNETS